MRLYELFEGIQNNGLGPDVEITRLTCDSREAGPGALFVCIKGLKFDGHTAAATALEQGAAAVVTECDLNLAQQIVVPSTREAYAELCGAWCGRPASKLKLIGVTGTNGKTTITYLIKHVLESAGKRVGLIGTIHNEIGDMSIPATHTTPDPAELHVLFARMLAAGCEYVVMEVSSHALDQCRLGGCHFAVGIFTNLTQDHLDYHETMENYYLAKRKLFFQCDTAVINADDEAGHRLLGEIPCKALTFSAASDAADYSAKDVSPAAAGSRFEFVGRSVIGRVRFCMPGRFSVSNAMAAGVAALATGVPFEEMVAGLCTCTGVTGRMEVLPTNTPFTVIRDYAHSPDGLLKACETVREFKKGRLITLFGCAGNRDRTKRPKMAEIVSHLSDLVILTSDNPRDEDPLQIIEDAKPGLLEYTTPYRLMPDRYAAIEWALGEAKPDDILLLAGKGHEDYQVLDFGTICFDEKEIVLRLLGERAKEQEQK